MLRNAQSSRASTAFLVTWSFLLLTVTGLVLYVVPKGRIANWMNWSFIGLDKEGWGDVHILFGGIFIVAGAIHLVYNWKPFRNYLAKRIKGHLEVKRELITSLAVTLLLIAGTIANVPPISWVFDLNEQIKASWEQDVGRPPPFGHAEGVALPSLAKRAGFDLSAALTRLRSEAITIKDEKATLQQIATDNHTTPAALYSLINRSDPASDGASTTLDSAKVEQRLKSTGIGGTNLEQFARTQSISIETALARLAETGIQAQADDTLKRIAERASTTPIEIAKASLIDGYHPSSM